MKLKLLSAACLAVLSLAAAAASANEYQLKFTTGVDRGVVNFMTVGAWTSPVVITGVSGEIDGSTITGLSNYAAADNTLYGAAPHLSFAGVSVSTAADTYNFSDYPFLVLNKASIDPGGYIDIPGTELLGGVVTQESAQTYQLSFTAGTSTGLPASDSGLVDFTTAGPWTSAITGVSGQIDGAAITGLSDYAAADNTLYDTAPHLSFAGVSVSTAGDTYNFGTDPFLVLEKASNNPNGFVDIPGTELVGGVVMDISSPAPEPSTWAMLAFGLGLGGTALRRRGAGRVAKADAGAPASSS